MKCFIISFKKIALAGIESRFLQIPEMFEPCQKLAGVILAMGQQQNPAIRVARPMAPPWAAVCQESLDRRKERRRHRGHPRNEVVLREICSAKLVVDPKTETLGPLPPIEWPDANGFYANLVLRQVRARLQPGWSSSGRGRLSAEWKVGGRSVVAPSARAKSPSPLEGPLTVAQVASAGALREPFETLLTELAQRRVQLPASGGRCP